MSKNKNNLFIVSAVALVNSLGYGIIIPVLYVYSQKFGLSDFQNGFLFAVFSIFQFVATPVIGRLSDKYGRKPLLTISLVGTAISFFTMAFAPSAIFLFLARALDGVTAGNIPVAQAIISDSTESKDRSRGFGILGASFGFGFVVGPAIAAISVKYGDFYPFLIAGIIASIAALLTVIKLPETNKNIGKVSNAKFFDFKKLLNSMFDKNVGKTLIISFFYSLAFSLLIYSYQPYAVKVLGMNATRIAYNFTLIGIVGLLVQLFVLPRVTRLLGDRKTLIYSLGILSSAFFGYFFSSTVLLFSLFTVVLAFANSFVTPMLQTILTKETDEISQGSMLGVSASYSSIGMIVGPVIGGAFATFMISMPFIVGAGICIVCLYLATKLPIKFVQKESAF